MRNNVPYHPTGPPNFVRGVPLSRHLSVCRAVLLRCRPPQNHRSAPEEPPLPDQGKLLLNDTCTPATMDSEDERIAHITGSRRRNMVNKLLSALLTSLCLCLLLAFMEYTPGHERDEHTYYFTFFSLVNIYAIYAVPITIVAGIPLSLLIESIDKKIFIRSKVKRYFMQVGLFTLAGITVALIFLLTNSGNVLHRVFDLDRYLIFIIPSLLFYHISLVIRFINKKAEATS